MRILCVLIMVAATRGALFAQSPEPPHEPNVFEDLVNAVPGTHVTVVRDDGDRLRGMINAVTPSELVLIVTGKTVAERIALSDLTTVVHNDPLSNGATIGFVWGLIASAAPLVWIGRICAYEGILADCVAPMIGIGAAVGVVGATVGVGIDALRRQVIYRRPSSRDTTRITVAPLIGAGHQGVVAQVSF